MPTERLTTSIYSNFAVFEAFIETLKCQKLNLKSVKLQWLERYREKDKSCLKLVLIFLNTQTVHCGALLNGCPPPTLPFMNGCPPQLYHL